MVRGTARKRYPMYETYNPYKTEDSRAASSKAIAETMEPAVPEEWRAAKSIDGGRSAMLADESPPINKRPAPWVGTVGLYHPLVAVVDKAESSGSTAWRVAGALAIVAGAVALLLLY